jgi:hypothetical protein
VKPPYRLLFVASLALNALLLLSIDAPENFVGAQSQSLYFPETGHTVSGAFLTYWMEHGGLGQQGYPLTEEFQEKSQLDGKMYTVQYFERAVFEKHPENPPPYDVLLSQLGKFTLATRYPAGVKAATRVTPPPQVIPPTATPSRTPKPTERPSPSPTAQPPVMSVPYCTSLSELRNEETFVCWSSETGDYIGQGENRVWTPANSIISLSAGRGSLVTVNIRDADYWSMDFAPPDGKPLHPGRYQNLDRYPFYNPVFGGFDASGDGRGCNELSARFEILENVRDPATGEVQRFAANFEQSCEKFMPPLRGEVRYNSSVNP